MTHEPVRRGGIIAAGAGSRLRRAGWSMPKPLVPVAGRPLIEHVVRNFLAVGIRSLVIIVSEEARECGDWVRSCFPDLDVQVLVKTTGSALESFHEVAARLGAGRGLISTVDALCPPAEFAAFVDAARRCPAESMVLAVTPLVADERPLYVSLDASGRVTHLGGATGDLVTAGMYLVPERVRHMVPPPTLGRLRDFLGWLLARGEPVYGVVLPAVVDVDRDVDVALAEALARGAGRPCSRAGEDGA